MRRGFTLIELIFSMVIIAFVFTIFPKIIQLSSKVSKNSLKEEAMYSGLALIGLIKTLPWDEENSKINDILLSVNGDSDYECVYSFANSASIYRKGSFVGSRNCIHKTYATSVGLEESSLDDADDIDDFDGANVVMSNYNGSREYNVSVLVTYMEDFKVNSESNGTLKGKDYISNVKYIELNVTSSSKKAKVLGDVLAKFWYISSNIGQLKVYSEPWSR